MTSFIDLWDSRNDLLLELNSLATDASSSHAEEKRAVIDIQRCFRGWRTRCVLKHWDDCARLIERVYRGHVGRLIASARCKVVQSQQRVALYEYCAAVIQKTFRGFYSRKYVHDFRARKAYIRRVVDASSNVRSCTTNIVWSYVCREA